MDIHQLIRSRRTIHEFDPQRQVPNEVIKKAIESACWAPNHHLTEPWQYYLLGQETIDAVCELNREIVTAAKGEEWEQGVGMKWSTGAITRDKRFYELVWLDPELEHIMGIFWYGYPAVIPQTLRKPVEQVITELP